MNENSFTEELKKFLGAEVIAEYMRGSEVKQIEGVIKGINFNHLSVIIQTPEEKVLVKHVIRIKRKREHPEK